MVGGREMGGLLVQEGLVSLERGELAGHVDGEPLEGYESGGGHGIPF